MQFGVNKITLPGCCEDGWRITLAGSRPLKPAETRYAPVEGERYDDLLLLTDHKPLCKLFGDLDEIENPRSSPQRKEHALAIQNRPRTQ